MPTLKKRINITVEDKIFDQLKIVAKKENSSVSSVSYALLERALELKEDLHFSNVGEDRLKSKHKRVKHKDIWV
jgi:hypothetical protein